MEEVDLLDLDLLLDLTPHQPHPHQSKATSLSEYPLLSRHPTRPDAAADLISASNSKQRSFSQPGTDVGTPGMDLSFLDTTTPGAPRRLPPPPAIRPPPPPSRREERKSLNGFHTAHRPTPALVELESENWQSERGTSVVVPAAEEVDTSSDDDVFHSGPWARSREEEANEARAPLMPSSTKSKRRHSARLHSILHSEGKGLMENFPESVDEYVPRVKKGRSWRNRVVCGVIFLLVNLLLAIVVALFVEFSGVRAYFWNSTTVKKKLPPPHPCPTLVSEYVGNFTPTIYGVYMVESPRTIRSKHGWLVLIPYGAFCDRNYDICLPGGVVGIEGETLSQQWNYKSGSTAEISSFTCNADLDGDGVSDCALVFKGQQARVELIGGTDGSLITAWDAGESGWTPYPPIWIQDQNGDGAPELLVPRQKGKWTEVQLWVSERSGRGKGFDFQPLRNAESGREALLSIPDTSTLSQAAIWKSGNEEDELVLVFEGSKGLLSYPLSQLLRASGSPKGTKGLDKWMLGPLFFGDVNGDWSLELVACEDGGGLVALQPEQPYLLWRFILPDFQCVGGSIGFLKSENSLNVLASFQSITSTDSHKMVLINGSTGKLLEKGGVHAGLVGGGAPLSGRMERGLPDVCIHWSVEGTKEPKLIGGAHLQRQEPLLNRSISTNFQLEDIDESDELEKVLNARTTGTFYSNNGTLNFFFTTQFIQIIEDSTIEREKAVQRLMLHKLNYGCKCSKPTCGTFLAEQPWSSSHGTLGDSVFA